ncbi:hypothetical protein CDV31_000556 [Fusarium ambrosium]|uniref:Uncharacterized protein n=1 Tax=Fusarium ambrosium TaxID=131363 RepID=A0A428V205_9HYPO|nr:hypothetical protein CDV31_000556 [Fusarium ambrosium]
MRVVNTAEVATDFASAARDAGLVNAFMLAIVCLVRTRLRGGLLLGSRYSRASRTGFGGPGCRLSSTVRGMVTRASRRKVSDRNSKIRAAHGIGDGGNGAERGGGGSDTVGSEECKRQRHGNGAEEKRVRRAGRQAARQQSWPGERNAVDGRVVAIER